MACMEDIAAYHGALLSGTSSGEQGDDRAGAWSKRDPSLNVCLMVECGIFGADMHAETEDQSAMGHLDES